MRWKGRKESSNVEDRRGMSPGGKRMVGGGIGTIAIVIVVLLLGGDIEEALNAASAVGDDNIQKQAQGYVVPESFTHGTSAQRKKWFYKGFASCDIRQGDTFGARDL